MKKALIPLEYEDPLEAVFLRTLAWEIYKAKRPNIPIKEQAEQLVQFARSDLGLQKTKGGAPHAFIQSLRREPTRFLAAGRSEPYEAAWRDRAKAWRLLNLPSHRIVRMLSHDPISVDLPATKKGFHQFSVSLRGAATPRLLVTVGKERPTGDVLVHARKGLYFLREHGPAKHQREALYVGKSDEFEIRWTGHDRHRRLDWWVFVAPVGPDTVETVVPDPDNSHVSSDTLAAAEALLISFWKEICHTTNRNRGTDKEPVFEYLQPAILLVEAASAVMLWLIRERRAFGFDAWNLPFKKCGAHGWPACYLEAFNKEAD